MFSLFCYDKLSKNYFTDVISMADFISYIVFVNYSIIVDPNDTLFQVFIQRQY